MLVTNFVRGFNPKMRITQSQPTVSATLVHHVARGSITPRPNIKRIAQRSVEYTDGSVSNADVIVFATGYKISFPFLSPEIASKVLHDPAANEISLYQNVFHPRLVARGLRRPPTLSLTPAPSQYRRRHRFHRPCPAVVRRSHAHG
jgi:hypothetical protein